MVSSLWRSPGATPATASQNYVRFTRSEVDYLTSTFAGATIADTDAFTFSGWLNFKEDDTGAHVIFRLDPTSATSTFMVSRAATSGFLSVIANGAFGTSSDEQFLIADGPQHILVTGQRTGGAWVLEMYRNGVAVANTPSSNNDVTIALATATRCRIGAGATPANTNALGAEASDFFFSLEYTASANVSRFYNGGWVNLGTAGTSSGAAAPLVYFYGPASRWNAGTNAGTLADAFTMTNAVTDV